MVSFVSVHIYIYVHYGCTYMKYILYIYIYVYTYTYIVCEKLEVYQKIRSNADILLLFFAVEHCLLWDDDCSF